MIDEIFCGGETFSRKGSLPRAPSPKSFHTRGIAQFFYFVRIFVCLFLLFHLYWCFQWLKEKKLKNDFAMMCKFLVEEREETPFFKKGSPRIIIYVCNQTNSTVADTMNFLTESMIFSHCGLLS